MEHKLNVVEGVKTELTHVLSSFEAIKKEMNGNDNYFAVFIFFSTKKIISN
jgi:hypothetical protein